MRLTLRDLRGSSLNWIARQFPNNLTGLSFGNSVVLGSYCRGTLFAIASMVGGSLLLVSKRMGQVGTQKRKKKKLNFKILVSNEIDDF